jgi:hypothetical protein
VVDFQKHNAALLIKFLDKFYNKFDLPWVHLLWPEYYMGYVPHAENLRGSFWWRDVLKQVDNFKGVSSVTMGSGNTFLFWLDKWNVDGSTTPLKDRFSRLYSFVLDDQLSATQVFEVHDMSTMFYLPLSTAVFEELNLLQGLMASHMIYDQKDEWTYTWGTHYKASKFYAHIHSHILVPKVYHWVWKSSCQMTTKVFAWLILRDRLNTRDMLQRRHWRVTYETTCVLCPLHAHEDRVHLFFECNFSQRIWSYLQISWDSSDDLQTIMDSARRSFAKPFFMEVVIMACWHTWLIRNANFFRNETPTFAKWRCNFIHVICLLKYRIKDRV